jgi:hypothetical protein
MSGSNQQESPGKLGHAPGATSQQPYVLSMLKRGQRCTVSVVGGRLRNGHLT